ncbi:protein MCM10 homolog [Suncus etruscus]|uniref:protein MCM10 homolog n=1 Tax=Suncus etruscus TaxID=109475 RepID=UPI00210F3E23|nr:protein MCM10 homolog [Suncus etruscus]
MDGDDENLSLLTSLLKENQGAMNGYPNGGDLWAQAEGGPDAFDELFDADGSGESYTEEVEDETTKEQKENVAYLFGDLTDEEEAAPPTADGALDLRKTNQELQDELRTLQKQMTCLQEKLRVAMITKPAHQTPFPGDRAPRPPLKEKRVQRIQESACFSAELDIPALPKAKRVAPSPKMVLKTPAGPGSSSSRVAAVPAQSTPGNKPDRGRRDQWTESPKASGEATEQVSLETYSGLRLRRPRVSSMEMSRKMAGRKLIRLSQLQEKVASEKLEEIDWVTFGVILNKITPQSCNSGKTFSIWYLTDLHDLTRRVSLFLFGETHKQLWKTAQGSVVGLLNANPMKARHNSEEVCLSIDHAQKVLIMGEALDLGKCRARKRNGEPCTQIVNLRDCDYCPYHIQAQYKRLSAKRSDLQSSFSGGRVPKKFIRGGASLKARLCQDGFYYGGVSSASYAAALVPKKQVQTTLTNLVVKGSDVLLQETRKKLEASKGLCSDEFRELMDLPTFGARNLKQHLANATSGAPGSSRPAIQSISASALLKQQKQHMLEMKRKRTEEMRKRSLQSSGEFESPAVPPPSGFKSLLQGASRPQLGRGLLVGADVLLDNNSPPPKLKLGALAEAKKLAAITKLRAKGQILTKTNPNTIKKPPMDPKAVLQVKDRVEKNIVAGAAPAEEDLEPARKKRKEQLAYLESEEFQKILKAKSRHTGVVKEAEAELQERYFEPLVKKEQLEDKMRSIRELKVRVVTCRTCTYTHFQPRDSCIRERHDLHWHEAVKRFFKCPCGNRAISLDRLPPKLCRKCGLFKWERDGMLKEKTGPKIGGETLLPRGEEHAKFLNSLK